MCCKESFILTINTFTTVLPLVISNFTQKPNMYNLSNREFDIIVMVDDCADER